MLTEKLVDKALKLGVDEVVCSVTDETTKQVKFVNNRIAINKTWSKKLINIFLVKGKKVITGVLPTEENERFLEKLVKMLRFIEPKEDYFGLAKGPFKYKAIEEAYDRRIERLAGRELDFVECAINSAIDSGGERASGVLYVNSWETRLTSSNAVEGKDRGTSILLSIRAFTECSSGHSVSVSRVLKKFQPSKAGEEAGSIAKESRKVKLGRHGRYSIIFHPLSMANLLASMSYGFSAFEVDAGTSFLLDKLGRKVASEIVTIEDDGRVKNGFDSQKFDEEGRPTKRTKLIVNGVLKSYLHNTSTAKKFKAKPTGNAGLIYPRPWNIVLSRGDSTLNEMIEEVRKGLYITNCWYTRFANYRTGDFSTIPRDGMFEIKNGEIVGAVKGLRVSDNMLRLLQNIIAISKKRRQVYWWEVDVPVITGHVLVKDVRITKSVK